MLTIIVKGGGQSHSGDLESSGGVDPFMQFVVQEGIPVLLELIEATFKLEMCSFFSLVCKAMTSLIKDNRIEK